MLGLRPINIHRVFLLFHLLRRRIPTFRVFVYQIECLLFILTGKKVLHRTKKETQTEINPFTSFLCSCSLARTSVKFNKLNSRRGFSACVLVYPSSVLYITTVAFVFALTTCFLQLLSFFGFLTSK